MNGRPLTDAQISSALRAHLPDRAYPGLRERILEATATTTQRRALPSFLGALSEADPTTRRRTFLIAAALLVGLALASVAAAGALRILERDPVHELSLEPPTPAPSVAPPSTHSSASPSPTTALIIWSQASLDEDWPAPVRTEPDGGAIVRPQKGPHTSARFPDASGDTGSAVYPWVDIRELQGTYTKVVIDLASNLPPTVPPTEQWIAYGVVVDDDRDGIPDRRFGIDNIPDGHGHRQWMTDLHTGQTMVGDLGGTYFDTFYPGEWKGIGARLAFGGDIAGGGTDGLRSPYYAWASVIVDGQVVARDYAPDVGWLDPSTAK
jgi:hypothetical protein